MERDLGLHVTPVALLERQPCFARGRRRSTCRGSACVHGEPAGIERAGEDMGGSFLPTPKLVVNDNLAPYVCV